MVTIEETKICKTCKQEKPIGDFYVNIIRKDGRHSDCKTCYQISNRIYYLTHKKEIKECGRIYYLTHKKEVGEYDNLHKKEAREYYNSHKKEWDRVYKIWEHNNPDKVSVYNVKRKALKLNALGHFTAQEWKALKEKYGNICLKCRKKKKLTVDHIVPLSKGGSNYISNVQPLCKSCNSKKYTEIIDYRFKENIGR